MPGLMRTVLAFVVAVAASGCSPLRALDVGGADDATRVTTGISYGENARQKLDIYVPAGVDKPPVVVFFYGGSWTSGSRADYAFVGNALSSRGILAVVADYRLYPQVSYPDFVSDSARAVAWTLAHAGEYGGDTQRVFVAGHSAGAYNAAMVSLDARWLAAAGASPAQLAGWIGISGPYDFLPIQDKEVKPVFHFPDTPRGSQPIHHVGPGAPPALLLTRAEDGVVDPVRNTGELAAALHRAGVPVRERIFPGKGHFILVGAFSRLLRSADPVLDEVSGFVHGTPVRRQAARP
ncbi:MAG TPA: alpha/beta hydrolase [Burkholderiales bacterium]|jgi:acetyl esterase/lipase